MKRPDKDLAFAINAGLQAIAARRAQGEHALRCARERIRQRRADDRSDVLGKVQRRLAEAEDDIRAGAAGPQQLRRIERVNAHLQPGLAQRGHRVFHMRERRFRQTAEIDDIGAIGDERRGARHDGVN